MSYATKSRAFMSQKRHRCAACRRIFDCVPCRHTGTVEIRCGCVDTDTSTVDTTTLPDSEPDWNYQAEGRNWWAYVRAQWVKKRKHKPEDSHV